MYSATISANNFNVSAGSTFFNQVSATINANDFNVTAGDRFYNTDSATISANDLTISADSFVNTWLGRDGNITANDFINNGVISANTLSLSVAGDFDYGSDFLSNGNVDATNQYFTIRNGDFTNNTSITLASIVVAKITTHLKIKSSSVNISVV